MQPITKEKFDKLSTPEKKEYAHYWASLNYKLKEHELKYLSGEDREEYLDGKVNSGTWLEDYEFNVLDKERKKTYIIKKKFLADDEVNRLDVEMQKFYVNNLTSNMLSMSEDAFQSLSSNKIRNLYVSGKMKTSNPINLKASEIEVLNKSQQKEYVDYFLDLDTMAIRPEYLDVLNPSVKGYYLKKSGQLNEVKKLVRSILKEQWESENK